MSADDLETARRADLGRRLGDQVGLDRGVEEGLGGDEGVDEVVGLVAAVQSEEHVLVHRPRRAQGEHPAVEGQVVAFHVEVPAPQPQALRLLRGEDLDQLGTGLRRGPGCYPA